MTTVPSRATAPTAVDLRRAALATAAVFAFNGFLMAAWVSRLPATRDRLHAGTASLGLALLMTGLGSLVAMPTTGRLCARYGSRRVVAATLVPSCVALVALAFLPTVWAVGAGLFVLGAGYGSWDVAMNVQASQVDRHAGRDLMPRYHGCWSAGAFVGALLGTLAAAAGVPLGVHFSADAAVVAVGVAMALRWFLPDPPNERSPGGPGGTGRRHAFVTRTLVLIGLVTLCATCIEGAAADWLALYLHDGRGTDPGLAAAGYAVFAVAMAASRFSGTAVIDRIGRVAAVRWGGALAGLGVLGAVLAPGVGGALLGGLLWGLGVAVIFPAAMSAGGETPGHAAQGIATVATIGYGGFLLGPPLIGLLAQHLGLGSALLVLAVLAAGIVALAPSVRPRPRPAPLPPR